MRHAVAAGITRAIAERTCAAHARCRNRHARGRRAVDAAVLDVDLNGEKLYPVADALALRDIRFIFPTSYDIDAVAEGHRHYPRCQKPFDHQAILKALNG